MSAAVEVLEPGLLTTVQDEGRFGFRDCGIPTGGAMDRDALRVANWLVGNDANAAVLEVTLRGPQLRALQALWFGCFGGGFRPRINGRRVLSGRPFLVAEGDVIDIEAAGVEQWHRRFKDQQQAMGCRGYLAMAGGIDVPLVMNSRSTCLAASFGGLEGRALKKGDVISSAPVRHVDLTRHRLPWSQQRLRRNWVNENGEVTLRALAGPEYDRLSEQSRQVLTGEAMRVGVDSNRMGFRLEGIPLNVTSADIVSSGVPEGTVQVPASGVPILLMADGQTIGGFARVANVITADLPRAAQLKPRDALRFEMVDLQSARQALRETDANWARLKLQDCAPASSDHY